MSVKSDGDDDAIADPSGASPKVRALVQSMVTNGSSPTTQASCPGGIS